MQHVVLLLVIVSIFGCSSEKEKRLQWNLDTTVKAYEKSGKHDSQWDDRAKEALNLYAHWRSENSRDASVPESIGKAAKTAVDSGCKDAMILYLYARFVINRPGHTPQEIIRAHQASAAKFKDSPYDPLRRFHACLRTGEALNKLDHVSNLAVAEVVNDAELALAQALEDNNAPHAELYQAAKAYLRCYERMNIPRQDGWHRLHEALRKKWGDDYPHKLAGGEISTD